MEAMEAHVNGVPHDGQIHENESDHEGQNEHPSGACLLAIQGSHFTLLGLRRADRLQILRFSGHRIVTSLSFVIRLVHHDHITICGNGVCDVLVHDAHREVVVVQDEGLVCGITAVSVLITVGNRDDTTVIGQIAGSLFLFVLSAKVAITATADVSVDVRSGHVGLGSYEVVHEGLQLACCIVQGGAVHLGNVENNGISAAGVGGKLGSVQTVANSEVVCVLEVSPFFPCSACPVISRVKSFGLNVISII